jgi:hypothetical protein
MAKNAFAGASEQALISRISLFYYFDDFQHTVYCLKL